MRIYPAVLALLGTVLAASLTSLVVAMSMGGGPKAELERLVVGSGVRLLKTHLESAPTESWPSILEHARPHFDFDLRIVSKAERHQARPPSPPEFEVPIGTTDQILVLGPVPAPSLQPLVWPLLTFATTAVVVASVMVSMVLAVRLKRTQRAIRLLGEGRWDHRLDANAEGPLRDLALHINRTAAQLSALFGEREELLQAVSHELGTPLTRMRFQLEILEQSASQENLKRIDQLCRDLDELDDLSQELVSWVEAGAPPHHRASFVVRDVLETLLELACQDDDNLEQRLEASPDVRLRADPRQFQRAIENLLRNAVRYAKKTLVLAAWIDEDEVVIDIRDDGIGIPESHRKRLFEPFTRIDGSRSRDEGGLGLGLAIVYRIVTTHGGTAEITEAPEGGACVRTRWPMLRTDDNEPSASAASSK